MSGSTGPSGGAAPGGAGGATSGEAGVVSDLGTPHVHRPPRDCPVCGARFEVTRLGCASCGSELSGIFQPCAFCGLGEADRELLEVFLVSRGNMREIERHLGVSYPTARQRYADLLGRLGLEPASGEESPPRPARSEILAQLASGDLDVDTATELLRTAE